MDILKVKIGNEWVGVPSIRGEKGDPGNPGDPSSLIDDSSGTGETGKTWSTDKLISEFGSGVDDVQINGASIVENGTANIPIAGTDLGLVKIVASQGVGKNSDGSLSLTSPNDAQYKNLNNDYLPVKLANAHKAIFYGLAKLAGDSTQASSSNTVGTYTDGAKSSIKDMLGITSSLNDIYQDFAIMENTDIATHNIANGSYVVWKGVLKKASAAIANGDALSNSNLGDVSDGGLNALSSEISGKAPTSHAVNATTYGAGTASLYGHVKLTDTYATVSTSQKAANSIGASAWAVQKVYDALTSTSSAAGDNIGSVGSKTTVSGGGGRILYKIGNIIILQLTLMVSSALTTSTTLFTVASAYRPSGEISAIAGLYDTGNESIKAKATAFTLATDGKVKQNVTDSWSSGWMSMTFIYGV